MTRRKPATPEAAQLLEARKSAAKELRLPITDWQVKRYALLMVAHDGLTARLAAGADFSVDALLKLDDAMAQIRASLPPERIKVDLEIVHGDQPVPFCKQCGWKAGDPVNGAEHKPPAPVIDAEAVKTVEPQLKSLPAPRAKPEGQPVERSHPGSIHDQPGVPLKRYDEPWRVYGRTS